MREVVVVGGGVAAHRAVVTLRSSGYEGRVTLIGEEPHAPYDRPPLSKGVLAGELEPEQCSWTSHEQLAELGVNARLGETALSLDLDRRRLELGDSWLGFDGLIIATGSSPRTLPHLACDERVLVLRTLDDALRLKAALGTARHVTVIGAGFIGSEVAATARGLGCEVLIVELETQPLSRSVGPEIGAVLMGLHADNGTEVRLGTSIEELESNGSLRARLTDGTTVETDVVVVGVGATPNTSWLQGSGLELANGVVCDASLEAAPRIFAVGDVASWPNPLFGRRMRVEHWMNAVDQAVHAARALATGEKKPFVGSNYVWSDQYGSRIQFVGVPSDDVTLVEGSYDERSFVAWYRQGDRLAGAVGIAQSRLIFKSRALIEAGSSWDNAVAAISS